MKYPLNKDLSSSEVHLLSAIDSIVTIIQDKNPLEQKEDHEKARQEDRSKALRELNSTVIAVNIKQIHKCKTFYKFVFPSYFHTNEEGDVLNKDSRLIGELKQAGTMHMPESSYYSR